MNKHETDQKDTTNETETQSAKSVCCGIYGFQNKLKPDAWYVGQSLNVYKRWIGYERYGCKNQPKFHSALQKYGYDGFNKVFLEECKIEELNSREIEWIKSYKCLKNGYNLSSGGEFRISDEGRRKSLLARMNRPRTEAEIKHVEKLHNLNRGRACTEETKRKISNAQLGKSREYCKKPRTEEVKRKISKSSKGRKRTKEFGERISLINKRRSFLKFLLSRFS